HRPRRKRGAGLIGRWGAICSPDAIRGAAYAGIYSRISSGLKGCSHQTTHISLILLIIDFL
ncbi:hypothetical protein, partial [Pseudomonas sp.]|uniref:hypothetical protein n=1 Tax=Pseudomonas sp. TaxID=306 RepID=UPI00356B47CB